MRITLKDRLNHSTANSIQRQIQPFNPKIGFNFNSIQTLIQPLKRQIGFNVNHIQRQIQP